MDGDKLRRIRTLISKGEHGAHGMGFWAAKDLLFEVDRLAAKEAHCATCEKKHVYYAFPNYESECPWCKLDAALEREAKLKEENEKLKGPKACTCWRCMGLDKDPYAPDTALADAGKEE